MQGDARCLGLTLLTRFFIADRTARLAAGGENKDRAMTIEERMAAEVERARSRYAATRRRRDVMPTRHETDFSVLEFADYPRDEAWVEPPVVN